jgi:uncharacterized protein (TIGR02145 family)
MKSSPSDTPAWNGTNSSGFSALPSGVRYDSSGSFGAGGYIAGYWWSSSANGADNAWYRQLYYGYANVYRNSSNLYGKRYGFSVRCVRDD